MLLSSSRVITCIITSYLYYFIVWKHHILFILLSVQLSWFNFLAVVNNAAMNIDVQFCVCVCEAMFLCFLNIFLGMGMAESYGNSVISPFMPF